MNTRPFLRLKQDIEAVLLTIKNDAYVEQVNQALSAAKEMFDLDESGKQEQEIIATLGMLLNGIEIDENAAEQKTQLINCLDDQKVKIYFLEFHNCQQEKMLALAQDELERTQSKLDKATAELAAANAQIQKQQVEIQSLKQSQPSQATLAAKFGVRASAAAPDDARSHLSRYTQMTGLTSAGISLNRAANTMQSAAGFKESVRKYVGDARWLNLKELINLLKAPMQSDCFDVVIRCALRTLLRSDLSSQEIANLSVADYQVLSDAKKSELKMFETILKAFTSSNDAKPIAEQNYQKIAAKARDLLELPVSKNIQSQLTAITEKKQDVQSNNHHRF